MADPEFTGFTPGFMGGHSVEEGIRARANTFKVAANSVLRVEADTQRQLATDYFIMLAEIDRLRDKEKFDANKLAGMVDADLARNAEWASDVQRREAAEAEVSKAKAEVTAVLDAMPKGSVVRVCEGGGPEEVYASLAVTALKVSGQAEQRAIQVDRLRGELEAAEQHVKILQGDGTERLTREEWEEQRNNELREAAMELQAKKQPWTPDIIAQVAIYGIIMAKGNVNRWDAVVRHAVNTVETETAKACAAVAWANSEIGLDCMCGGEVWESIIKLFPKVESEEQDKRGFGDGHG